MSSYYNKVTGTIETGKTARSGDIHLIQSSIQDAIQRMIVDMFGPGFVLGESENALKLYPTNTHVDQSNANYNEYKNFISFYDTYFRQPIDITKSSIETIRVQMINQSNITTTIYAEIRDSTFDLVQEANATLAPTEEDEYAEVDFNFSLNHLPLGRYFFVLRPVDISATDLTLSGDETPHDTIDASMFQVRYDMDGSYNQGLEASYDGSNYLDAYLIEEDLVTDENGDLIEVNSDLVFEHVFSSGNTYLITNGAAVVLGEKVYPLDTHVTIDGPSTLGDRTDLVTLTTDGRLNVTKGTVYNGERIYPTDDTGLKIAYITSFKSTSSSNSKIPAIEQDDTNNMTRHRDVIERLRRLEKKVDYQMANNSPRRIKYNCVVDPILSNNGVDEDAEIRGEGTYNVSSSTNSDNETIITSTIALNYAWSIIKNNYTYSALTGTSVNAELSVWDTVTTETKPSSYNTGTPGMYFIHIEAVDLSNASEDGTSTVGTQPLSGLALTVQIKKGGTLKQSYEVTTNKYGQVDLSIWSAQLSKGSYNIYVIYEESKVQATLTVHKNDEEVENKDIEKHTLPITITKNSKGSVTHTLPDGVIPGDDSFYKDNVVVDIENGEVRVDKIGDSVEEYRTNTLLKDMTTFDSMEVMYQIRSDKKALTSEYPIIHLKIDKDTHVKTITPYISGFQNIESFGILIFKNDAVFDMVNSTRQVMQKKISTDDVTFPTVYDSGLKSLADLVTQSGNYKVLKNQVEFDVDLDFDAGTYSLMVYAKLEAGQAEGTIRIKEYKTLENATQYGISTKCIGGSQLSVINMDTSNLTDRSWDVAIEQKAYQYYDKGILISKPQTVITPIAACNVTRNFIIPNGCDINLYVSNNGGISWINADSGHVKFNSDGSSFRWKLEMYATASATPKLKYNSERQSAISFTLATTASYVEYEDYHRCYETPLLNANAITRTFTATNVSNKFSEWEFARIYMEDEELRSKIDICIGYADNAYTNVDTQKANWDPKIFFSTVFSDLQLSDFSRTSVDYDNYDDGVEYDEYNYHFDMNSDDVMHYTGGNALASPDAYMEGNTPYAYGNINLESNETVTANFEYAYEDRTYTYIDNDGDKTQMYAGMHITDGPYYKATFSPSVPLYNKDDIIIGVKFPNGLDVDENFTYVSLGITPHVSEKHTGDYVFQETNDKGTVENKYCFPPNTFEVVIALNENGLIEDDNAVAGKAYPISSKLISDEYNEVSISFIDDLEGLEASDIKSIGIRINRDIEEITENSPLMEGDFIGLGRLSTTSYNIRPYVPYMYSGRWDRLTWNDASNNPNKKSKAYSIYALGRKDAYTSSWKKGFYPIDDEFDTIDGENRVITYQAPDTFPIWDQTGTSFYKNGEDWSKASKITRNGITITTEIPGQGTFVTNDSGNEILFDLAADETGNLFKINTDIPFTIYDLIDVEYFMFCEYYPASETHKSVLDSLLMTTEGKTNFMDYSNVQQIGDNIYRTDGAFSKGEIILDFYDTRDIDGVEPVESLPLPAWGRVATRAQVSEKYVHSWFKKRSSATNIKCIVLRRENPRNTEDSPYPVPHIRLVLSNILLFNSATQLALGPQMQYRIYPNQMDNTKNTKIRKIGAIYRLK